MSKLKKPSINKKLEKKEIKSFNHHQKNMYLYTEASPLYKYMK